MAVSKRGASKMPAIVANAPGDIRQRLWTLYWLARLLTQSGPSSTGIVVELGVREGDSTRALLAACEDGDGWLYSFDVVECENTVRRRTAEMGFWFDSPWSFRVEDSVAAGNRWRLMTEPKAQPADFVFIDTDHTYATTKAELAAWSPLVRRGGCMAFHDYWLHDPSRDENQGHGVKMAVDEFAGAHGDSWGLESHDSAGNGDTGFALLWRL